MHAREPHHSTPTSCSTPSSARTVNALAIVGDAFAKPMLRPSTPTRATGTSRSIVHHRRSGVMWSEETKQGLLRHHPAMLLVDAFSSSEALGMGQSVSTAGGHVDDRQVRARRERPGHHRRRPRRRARARARSGGSRSAASSPSATTRTRRSRRRTFVEIRRRPLLDARRLRHGRGRRHAHAARPRLGVHQHRRREGLPRGGRGGAEDAPRRARRRRRRRARREVRRGDHRRRRAEPGPSSTRPT